MPIIRKVELALPLNPCRLSAMGWKRTLLWVLAATVLAALSPVAYADTQSGSSHCLLDIDALELSADDSSHGKGDVAHCAPLCHAWLMAVSELVPMATGASPFEAAPPWPLRGLSLPPPLTPPIS